VTGDERSRSLADQAAAWVPPWQRADAPAQAEAPAPDPAAPAPTVDNGDEPAASALASSPDLHDQINFSENGPTEPVDSPSFPETDLIKIAETGTSTDTERPGLEGRDEAVTTSPGEPRAKPPGELAPEPTAEPSDEPLAESAPAPLVEPGSAPPAGSLAEPVPASLAGPSAESAAESPAPLVEPSGEPDSAMDPVELRGALEAILLVVDEPVSEAVLAQALGQPAELLARMLGELAAEYATARRGFELRRAAGGWRLYTRGEYSSYVERFVLDGQQVRLTQAALETLAVVAYKQPVTRSRISAIRGVNCDAVVRTLVSRGLIEECGAEPDSGAYLYRTTTLFLEKLALDSVADLPSLAPFLPDDVDELTDVPPR